MAMVQLMYGDGAYWRKKTFKASRRKARKVKLLYHAGILARASKIGSHLYRFLPQRATCRENYLQLTGWVMQLIKEGWNEADIIAELLPTLPIYQPEKCRQPVTTETATGVVVHPNGQYYFITSLYKRVDTGAANALSVTCYPTPCTHLLNTVTESNY